MYIDQLKDKSLKILIPGSGNSYEAEYLFNSGFKNVHVVDVSKTALDHIKTRLPDFPNKQALHQNFFELNANNTFDLILEQTFLCALHPNLRLDYVSKMLNLLKSKGKLVGVLFNEFMTEHQPPYVAKEENYRHLFEEDFQIEIMEPCYNSTGNRAGKELFFKLIKP